jgi:hypothetical protein
MNDGQVQCAQHNTLACAHIFYKYRGLVACELRSGYLPQQDGAKWMSATGARQNGLGR